MRKYKETKKYGLKLLSYSYIYKKNIVLIYCLTQNTFFIPKILHVHILIKYFQLLFSVLFHFKIIKYTFENVCSGIQFDYK